jgi:hypothetical protein
MCVVCFVELENEKEKLPCLRGRWVWLLGIRCSPKLVLRW